MASPAAHSGFEGADDDFEMHQLTSSADLNKTLPPDPLNTPSVTHSPSSRQFSSASFASSIATQFSVSGKIHFRNVTRGLVHPEDDGMIEGVTPPIPSLLDPSKYDPSGGLDSSRATNFPHFSYASIKASNPFEDEQTLSPIDHHAEAQHSPSMPDPVKSQRQLGIPQSYSEGSLYDSGYRNRTRASNYHIPPTLHEIPKLPNERLSRDESRPVRSPTRGRVAERPSSPVKVLQNLDEDSVLDVMQSPQKRSRSPHKKLFGEGGWLSKSTSLKELSTESGKKGGLKTWGEKLKSRMEDLTENVMKGHPHSSQSEQSHTKNSQLSTFPVSLDPPTQAKLYCEIELMICVTANKFLVQQYKHGRMSPESVTRVTSYWASKNRPQVIEFQFDQATQRDLILHNLKTFQFQGESGRQPIVLNSTMYNWKTISKEMSVRTFCNPDSVVKKHMHDTHKVLEMLGAPLVTFLAFQELQVKALATIQETQKKKAERIQSDGKPKQIPLPIEYAKRTSPIYEMDDTAAGDEHST